MILAVSSYSSSATKCFTTAIMPHTTANCFEKRVLEAKLQVIITNSINNLIRLMPLHTCAL